MSIENDGVTKFIVKAFLGSAAIVLLIASGIGLAAVMFS